MSYAHVSEGIAYILPAKNSVGSHELIEPRFEIIRKLTHWLVLFFILLDSIKAAVAGRDRRDFLRILWRIVTSPDNVHIWS